VIVEIDAMALQARGRALLMRALEHEQLYDRMLEVTSRFRQAVNFRGDIAVPLLPRHPATTRNPDTFGGQKPPKISDYRRKQVIFGGF
jgi:hypothetical protein